MPNPKSSFVWFLLFFTAFMNGVASSETMRLELVHRLAVEDGSEAFVETPRQRDRLDRVKELLRRDRIREWMRAGRRRGRNVNPDLSGDMPMKSAADYGTGQYLVTLEVGNPSQRVTLIADTGSDLTWMKCESVQCGAHCGEGERRKRGGRRPKAFRADESSSFRTVPCCSDMCKVKLADSFSLKRCPTPLAPCAFDYGYVDGSTVAGIFANETLTLGPSNLGKRRLHNVLVGCAQSYHSKSFHPADGVLGMGFSKFSFARKAAKRYGGKFSYCLVDHLSPKTVSNYLTFGSTSPQTMQFTDLALEAETPFYAVHVLGISIGGVMLNIPPHVWDLKRGGGTILDSGTSLTFLSQPAYQLVTAALQQSLLKFRRVNPGIEPLEYCFDSMGFIDSVVPKLGIHFTGGARFEPPVKSYVIEALEGVRCLGFVSAAWPGTSTIGNILQQNHLWEFDLIRYRVGFAPSECT